MNSQITTILGTLGVAIMLSAPCRGQQDEFEVDPDVDVSDSPDDQSFDLEEIPPGKTVSDKPSIDDQVDDESPQADLSQPDALETDDLEQIDAGPNELASDELIRERYPDGTVRIQRGVTQDEQDNYVNHGSWTMFDKEGKEIVSGTYAFGRREGKWVRWYQPGEAPLFATAPYVQFRGPYVSVATFRDGQLDGQWTIKDQNGQTSCDWQFIDGRRDGKSTWYYPNGKQLRVINYRLGEIHGEMMEWSASGELLTRVEYIEGRRLDDAIETYKSGQKRFEGKILHARLAMKEQDDWWQAKLASYRQEGQDEKHGTWTAWFENGQKKFSGQYQFDKPSGEFTWWHTNGQKSLQASYLDGKKNGVWTWWHENGQKSIRGEYVDDSPVNRWIWWRENGKVAQRVEYPSTANPIVATPPEATTKSTTMTTDATILLQRPRN